MRFALVAELLAVASMLVVIAPLVALAVPTLALELLATPEARAAALQWLAVGVPALALWMVAAHATHGAALDLGATRAGARSQRRRALRFGLYACGWDLMAGPLGFVVTLTSRGFRATLDVVSAAMVVPGRASLVFLEGVYALGPDAVGRARRAGGAAAVALALLSGVLVVALLVARLL
jgi:hypothetical protein